MKTPNTKVLSPGKRLLFFGLCPFALLLLLGSACYWKAGLSPRQSSGSTTPVVEKKPEAQRISQTATAALPKEPAQVQRKLKDHSLARFTYMKRKMRADPACAEILKRDLRRRTMNAYADLFRTLSLPAEKMEKLKEILDRHTDLTDELRSLLAEQGVNANDPLYAKAFSNANRDREAEVRSFFDKEGLDYALYDRATQSLDWVTSYSPEFDLFLELKGCSRLGSEEALKLRNTIADVRLSTRETGEAGQDLLKQHSGVAQEVVRRMSGTLSEAQSEVLRQYFAMVLARNEAVRLVTRPTSAPGSLVYGSSW